MNFSSLKLKITLLLVLLVQIIGQSSNSTNKTKCYALALEGGGDAAAYEVGVLKGLIENLSPEEVQYQVVSGVSAGALNGIIISSFPIGQEQNMITYLLNLLSTNLSESAIYESWGWGDLGVVEGLFDKSGIYNNAPLATFLQNYVKDHEIYRKFTIGVTDATYVQKLTFFGDQLSKENLAKAVLASTSMPFIFPYVNVNNQNILIDGGCLMNIDIESAIQRCREIVNDDSDIIIDALMQTEASIDIMDPTQSYSSLDMLERYQHINNYKTSLNSLIEAVYNHPDVNFRYVVFPSKKLPRSYIPIYFSSEDIQEMIQQGEQDAIKAIQNSASNNLNQLNFNLINLTRSNIVGNEYFDNAQPQQQNLNFIQKVLEKQKRA